VIAWDFEGKQKWRQDLKFGQHGWGTGASPVLAGGLVILTESMDKGVLVALSKKDGSEVWRQPDIGQAWDTPLLLKVGGHDELIMSAWARVLAFDPAKGTPLWKAKGIWGYMCPSVVAADGVVYAIGSDPGEAMAVKAGGKGDVPDSDILWRVKKGSNVSSPIYHAGHLFWAKDNGEGKVYCVNTMEGKLTYEATLPQPTAAIYASPIIGAGNLYYVSWDGTTYVVAAKPKFELVAVNKLAEDKSIFNASPVPSRGQLLIRSDRFLYCIGAK
jgi:outer membrane protein assembly factor BamB